MNEVADATGATRVYTSAVRSSAEVEFSSDNDLQHIDWTAHYWP